MPNAQGARELKGHHDRRLAVGRVHYNPSSLKGICIRGTTLNVGRGHYRLRVLIGVVDDREANSTVVEVNRAIPCAENPVVV